MHRLKFVVAIGAFSLIVAACGGGTEDTTTTAAPAGDTTTTVAETTTTAAETTTTVAETTTVAPPTTEGQSAEVAEFLAAMAEATAYSTAQMEGSILMAGLEGVPVDGPLEITFSGAFDNDSGEFSMVMDLGGFMEALGGAGEEIPPELAASFSEMEMRVVGDTAYLKFGFFNLLGVTTEWISMPAEDAGGVEDFTGGFTPSNPADMVEAFEEYTTDVQNLGTETVRGVTTTHWRMVVDAEKAAELGGEEAVQELEEYGPIPISEFPIDLWIGDDGRLYKMEMTIDGSEVEFEPGEAFESMVMVFEIFGFDEPVTIEAPDPSNVTDAEELGGLFGDF